jgi:hypothetical protein
MSREVIHPLTKVVYSLTPEGLVQVHDPKAGLTGLFDSHGRWQSGELRDADIQVCGWVGRTAEIKRLRATEQS